ncbi:MAG TPA: hypothetical protein VG713_12570 [Pirellulales bacterium]|nr:hypothetical protein [Pirellulales bacterium]
MVFSRLLPIVVGAVVTFNHFHCVCYHAIAAGEWQAAVRASLSGIDGIDQGPVPRCKNESGCICQGAVFVAAPQVAALDLTAWNAIVEAPVSATRIVATAQRASLDDLWHHGVPISGRILRAHLASLLI